jgi:hypothetical protein
MLNVATDPKTMVSTDSQLIPDVRTVATDSLIMASPARSHSPEVRSDACLCILL